MKEARITRAKKTLAAARVPFAVPAPDELAERSELERKVARLTGADSEGA